MRRFDAWIDQVKLVKSWRFVLLISLCSGILACNLYFEDKSTSCLTSASPDQQYALLASRFKDLDSLKSVVKISYTHDPAYSPFKRKKVELEFCSQVGRLYSEMAEGLSQAEVLEASRAGPFDKLSVLFKEPMVIQNRNYLKEIFLLARRRNDLYGFGDPAFYDLALQAFLKLEIDNASLTKRDRGAKGFLNTFNHITAQAIITSIYSADLADLVADLHERENMPELIDGSFTVDQLNDSLRNPVDNYVDMINNEIGQLLGERLNQQFQIKMHQFWTPKLLCSYLNELQKFYSVAFQLRAEPFHWEEEVVIRFCHKLNTYYDLPHEII